MALSNIQERVERSIFEKIRLLLVTEGYLPDITNYPENNTGQQQWKTDLQAIDGIKGFAAEVFGHGNAESKGQKRTPRIAIIPRRILPGDIGTPIEGYFEPDPLDPKKTIKRTTPPESAILDIDIHLVSSTAKQDRVLHAILNQAIGSRGHIPFYDSPKELFFIKQYNYYDIPDTQEGIEEKVYSYEVRDLYLTEGTIQRNIPTIKEITVETTVLEIESILAQDGSIIGPYVNGDEMVIDLSGINF
jgi:hypothetical protein